MKNNALTELNRILKGLQAELDSAFQALACTYNPRTNAESRRVQCITMRIRRVENLIRANS